MLLRFLEKHWVALLAAVSVSLFIYLFTRHSGIGISPDSVNYFSAATNIRNHFSFTDYNGLPLVDFPLGYPVFLALFSSVSGFGVLSIAPVVNAVLFSCVILFTSVILDGYKHSTLLYRVIFLSVLAFSPALLEIYSMLWSETLFIFLSLLFIICFRYYFISHSYARLFLVGLIAAVAFVTRYAGISLILTGGMLLFFDGELSIRKKILQILLFGCTGISLVVINLVRNHLATQSLTGVREKALRTVSDNITQAGAVLAEWLPFLKCWAPAGAIFFVAVFILAVLFFVFRVLQQQYFHRYETIVSAYFIGYIVFIITIASVSRFEDLSNRLLSPVYIPLLLVATGWIPAFTASCTRIKRRIIIFAGLLLFASLAVHQYKLNAEAWEGIRDAGMPGYTEDSWQTSSTILYLRTHHKELTQPLYSDAPDAAWFLAGLHALPLPHKEINEEIDALLQKPSLTVIWLDDGYNDDLISLDIIHQHKKLAGTTKLADGAIYHFSDTTITKR